MAPRWQGRHPNTVRQAVEVRDLERVPARDAARLIERKRPHLKKWSVPAPYVQQLPVGGPARLVGPTLQVGQPDPRGDRNLTRDVGDDTDDGPTWRVRQETASAAFIASWLLLRRRRQGLELRGALARIGWNGPKRCCSRGNESRKGGNGASTGLRFRSG